MYAGLVSFYETYQMPKSKLPNDLVYVYPPGNPWHDIIVFDVNKHEYYNKKTDIYLTEDDILFHKLKPASEFLSEWRRSNESSRSKST